METGSERSLERIEQPDLIRLADLAAQAERLLPVTMARSRTAGGGRL